MQSAILYLILALVFAAVVIAVQTVTGLAISAGGAKRFHARCVRNTATGDIAAALAATAPPGAGERA